MDRRYIIDNEHELDRLRKLVNTITDEELDLTLHEEGWTIAVALAHVAFWDRHRLSLVRKWKQEGVKSSPFDENIINDALIPFFLEIKPRKAAEMSITTAEKLDQELTNLSPELISAIEALGDRHALNRSIHRKMHLDDIDTFLIEQRKMK
ncbi:MAG: DinB family protein [Dehalococcoidales bacterium]|nr:MAG: DinB family protein [Dehalococcoidales bacterium]